MRATPCKVLSACSSTCRSVSTTREAVEGADWRLADDSFVWQCNSLAAQDDHSPLTRLVQKPADASTKAFGCMINVQGRSAPDMSFKASLARTALATREDMWIRKASTRVQKYKLMHKVSLSAVSWSAPAWNLTVQQQQTFRAIVTNNMKTHLRLPRYRGEAEDPYHRRCNREVTEVAKRSGLPDFDVLLLLRKYDYAGHAMRLGVRKPYALLPKVISWRDKDWQLQHEVAFSWMGHSGRTSPWMWESTFHRFFAKLDTCWKDVAISKADWKRHRRLWVRDALGNRLQKT